MSSQPGSTNPSRSRRHALSSGSISTAELKVDDSSHIGRPRTQTSFRFSNLPYPGNRRLVRAGKIILADQTRQALAAAQQEDR
jgi:hypothetical protein